MTFILSILHNPYQMNRISGVIDHGFEPLLGQTKDYKIGIIPEMRESVIFVH
jgi:hypothetical protein